MNRTAFSLPEHSEYRTSGGLAISRAVEQFTHFIKLWGNADPEPDQLRLDRFLFALGIGRRVAEHAPARVCAALDVLEPPRRPQPLGHIHRLKRKNPSSSTNCSIPTPTPSFSKTRRMAVFSTQVEACTRPAPCSPCSDSS